MFDYSPANKFFLFQRNFDCFNKSLVEKTKVLLTGEQPKILLSTPHKFLPEYTSAIS